jgi:uncharacterized protein
MGWLDPEELRQLLPAETGAFPSPIPTQSVSSDEFMPALQTAKQREFEARVKQYGSELAHTQGVSRRAFFTTAAGMAAAFMAMNDTYGRLYTVTRAEAATPEIANERAKVLSEQFIMDMHTHFLRDDTRNTGFVRMREAVGKAGWNPMLVGKPQTIEDLKFANYFKEIFLDSDTKVACISGAPSEIPEDWFLTNEMKAEARAKVNTEAGTRRMLAHAIFTPGQPGWLEQVDRPIEALRRLEIPKDMQKQYGFQPLGPADGPIKTAILGGNNARLYKYPIKQKAELFHDRFAQFRERYEQSGEGRSNLTYGYIRKRTAS